MTNLNFPAILHGGDYNPDQWPEEIWHEDMRLFREAGVNLVTLPVFSWARLQPAPDVFDFEWLDRALDLIEENGLMVCLSTPTVAQPAWMARLHPEMMPVDEQGRRRTHGKRVNFCPNSPVYRAHAARMAREMADRYAHRACVKLWHVANEYGTLCWCDVCRDAFRDWLKARYGTVEELNRRWNLAFWGHLISDWEDIVLPSELNDDNKWYQPKMLDYRRFMTDSSIGCFENEAAILRAANPSIPVTTNISGLIHMLDQHRFAPHVDIVGWDNYPAPGDPPAKVALKHDLMRGLKDGRPYLMIEQSPNQQNWQPVNVSKRPGELRRISWQALAHGAESVLYFQLRQSVAGVEKFHGAVIGHAGHSDTRTFREVAHIGRELAEIGPRFLGTRMRSDVAIVFDWDSWWGVSLSSGPHRDLDYFDQVRRWHAALHARNLSVDVVRHDADLSGYRLVIAPLLYLLKPGDAARFEAFVRNGGTFVSTVFTGIVNENDEVGLGGYPAELRELLGLWIEEFDALPAGSTNRMQLPDGRTFGCGLLCGIVRPSGAQTMAVYGEDFYAGTPCLTRNRFGCGEAWQVATDPDDAFIADFLAERCREAGIRPVLTAPSGVEATARHGGGMTYLFVLNHGKGAVEIDLKGQLPETAFSSGRIHLDGAAEHGCEGAVRLSGWIDRTRNEADRSCNGMERSYKETEQIYDGTAGKDGAPLPDCLKLPPSGVALLEFPEPTVASGRRK